MANNDYGKYGIILSSVFSKESNDDTHKKIYMSLLNDEIDSINKNENGQHFGILIPVKSNNNYMYVCGSKKSSSPDTTIRLSLHQTEYRGDKNNIVSYNASAKENNQKIDTNQTIIYNEPVAVADVRANQFFLLNNVAVEDDQTNNGYGTILARVAEDIARCSGYDRIYATRHQFNDEENNLVYKNFIERNIGSVGNSLANLKSHILGKRQFEAYSNFLSHIGYTVCDTYYQLPNRIPRHRGLIEANDKREISDKVIRFGTEDFLNNISNNREKISSKSSFAYKETMFPDSDTNEKE